MRIRFSGRVIDYQTDFRANALLDTMTADGVRDFTSNGIVIRDGEGAEADTLALLLPQPVVGQDVVNFLETDALEDRNSLAVIADLSSQSRNALTNLRVQPTQFTPNGDGINDEVKISFDVQRLLIPRALHVEIHDLGGRLVRRIERNVASGGHSATWDGRSDEGEVVAPGLYLLRVSTEADYADAAKVRLVGVVY